MAPERPSRYESTRRGYPDELPEVWWTTSSWKRTVRPEGSVMVVVCLLLIVDALWPREGAGAVGQQHPWPWHPLHPRMTMDDILRKLMLLLVTGLLENDG